EMQVVDDERAATGEVSEPRPGGDAGNAVTPMHRAGHLGRIREPESAALDRLEPPSPEKNGGILAFRLPVIPAHADLAVALDRHPELIQLVPECFLDAEQVRSKVPYHLEGELAAPGPGVGPVACRAITDVEGHDPDFRRRCGRLDGGGARLQQQGDDGADKSGPTSQWQHGHLPVWWQGQSSWSSRSSTSAMSRRTTVAPAARRTSPRLPPEVTPIQATSALRHASAS